MEKFCLHCGSSFETGRQSKKYCRETCKQMAYLHRNGLTRVHAANSAKEGTVNTVIDGTEEKTTPAVNDVNEGVNNVNTVNNGREEQPTEVQNETVLPVQSVSQANVITPDLLEQLFSRFAMTMDARLTDAMQNLKQEITEQRETEYDEEDYNEQEYELFSRPEKIEALELAGEEEEESSNESEDDPEPAEGEATNQKKIEEKLSKLTTQAQQETMLYRWVNASFIKKLEKYNEQAIAARTQTIFFHTDELKTACLKWVNTRFLCLLDCYIKCSFYTVVRRDELTELANAFISLFKSMPYQKLPSDYPFKELIQDITLRLREVLTDNRKAEIKLRLTEDDKARLTMIREIIAAGTKRVRFKDLDFRLKAELPDTGEDQETPAPKKQLKRNSR